MGSRPEPPPASSGQTYIGGQGCPSTGDVFATDSSGFHIYVTANDVLVYAPDGTLVHSDRMVDQNNRKVLAKDSNGNYMSVNVACPSSVYDTLGHLMISASSVCGGTTVPSRENDAGGTLDRIDSSARLVVSATSNVGLTICSRC